MRNLIRNTALAAVIGVLAGIGITVIGPQREAQSQPGNNPAFLPTAILPVETIATGVASTHVIQTNGAATVLIRVAGSPTGLAATVQGTETRAGTPAWTNLPVDTVGGVRIAAVSAAGLYRVNASGFAQIRLNVTALTSGATTVSMSAGVGGPQFAATLPAIRATYTAASTIATGGTTHFLVIAGSATKTVRVLNQQCSGKATAALAVAITANKNSTADSVDAGTGVTATPHDSANAAATATVVSHTTSPTSGTLVGTVQAGTLALVVDATPITPANVLNFDYGAGAGAQEVVLRGVAESLSLSTSAAFGSGAAVTCKTTWTEE